MELLFFALRCGYCSFEIAFANTTKKITIEEGIKKMKEHEKNCLSNPKNKTCLTCEFLGLKETVETILNETIKKEKLFCFNKEGINTWVHTVASDLRNEKSLEDSSLAIHCPVWKIEHHLQHNIET